MKKKEIRVRCWLDIDGVKHFGKGRAELLELILQSGSIAKAAKKMGMSYKKAWDMVIQMNEHGQKPYVVARKGGSAGGGAEVTDTGKKILSAYQKLNREIDKVIAKDKQILKNSFS